MVMGGTALCNEKLLNIRYKLLRRDRAANLGSSGGFGRSWGRAWVPGVGGPGRPIHTQTYMISFNYFNLFFFLNLHTHNEVLLWNPISKPPLDISKLLVEFPSLVTERLLCCLQLQCRLRVKFSTDFILCIPAVIVRLAFSERHTSWL